MRRGLNICRSASGWWSRPTNRPVPGQRHHDGVAVTGPVRFGEASDQAQNLAVPSLTGADVSDRETASASGSETSRTTGSEPCSMPANLTGACWARLSSDERGQPRQNPKSLYVSRHHSGGLHGTVFKPSPSCHIVPSERAIYQGALVHYRCPIAQLKRHRGGDSKWVTDYGLREVPALNDLTRVHRTRHFVEARLADSALLPTTQGLPSGEHRTSSSGARCDRWGGNRQLVT